MVTRRSVSTGARTIVAIGMALGLSNAWAEDMTVVPACPASIDVQETPGASVPPGWTATLDSSPRYLDGVAFFDGPPGKNQSLAPTVDATPLKGRDLRVASWSFGHSGAPVWFACRYGGSRVVLSQALPITIRTCSVTYGAGSVVTAVQCRQSKIPPSR